MTGGARKVGRTVPPPRPWRAAAFFVGFFAGFWTPPAPAVALRFEAAAFVGGGGICAPPLCANGRDGTNRTRVELPAAAAPLGLGTGCGGTRASGRGTV